LTQKLLALFTQVIALNAVVVGAGLLTARILSESVEMRCFLFLHIVYLVMQMGIIGICFGISAFVKRGVGRILTQAKLQLELIDIGIVTGVAGIVAAYLKYTLAG
jgi:hypothetical protein